MRIGRSRSWAASVAAVNRSLPSCSCWRANSTIRMAFLLARPISTTKPICARMLMSRPAEQQRHDREQQAQGHDQHDRQRQRPALVLRRQHQEHEEHAQRETPAGRGPRPASAGRPARSTGSRCRAAGSARQGGPWSRWSGPCSGRAACPPAPRRSGRGCGGRPGQGPMTCAASRASRVAPSRRWRCGCAGGRRPPGARR